MDSAEKREPTLHLHVQAERSDAPTADDLRAAHPGIDRRRIALVVVGDVETSDVVSWIVDATTEWPVEDLPPGGAMPSESTPVGAAEAFLSAW